MAPTKTKDAPRGTIHGSSSNATVNFTVRAVPLPIEITSFLQANTSTMRRIQLDRRGARVDADDETEHVASKQLTEAGGGEEKGAKEVKPEAFWAELEKVCAAAGREWAGVADQVWAFGPKRVGPNLLIDRTGSSKKLCVLLLEKRRRPRPTDPLLPRCPSQPAPAVRVGCRRAGGRRARRFGRAEGQRPPPARL